MLLARALVVGSLWLATSACAHIDASRCAGSAADEAAIGSVIRSYFAALAVDDEAAAARLTTPSFYSFDGGKRFTNAELVALVKQAHQRGTVLQWNIGPLDTHFDCNSAWAAWENVGAAGPRGALKPVKWLETAMLRRHQGQWRMEFLHSSRAQPD